MKDAILTVLILLSTLIFFSLNTDKLEYVWRRTFEVNQNMRSHIVRIQIHANGRTLKNSFVDRSVVDAQGKPVLFVSIPPTVALDKATVVVNEKEIPSSMITSLNDAVTVLIDENRTIYFISKDFSSNVAHLIIVNNLVVQ